MKSYKTTALAILTFVIILAGAVKAIVDDDPNTNPDFTALMAAASAASIGLVARDNTVTSEQAGAK